MNQIHIILHDQDVEPGKQLSGMVALRILTPVQRVMLRVHGQEHVSFIQGNPYSNQSKVEETKTIMNFETPLGSQEGFGVGDYKLPINFTMPSGAPSSFEMEEGTSIAKITYFLIVAAGNATNQKKIIVTRKVFPWVAGRKQKLENSVKVADCLEVRTVYVSALLEKTIFQSGEILKGVGVINNLGSETQIKKINPEIFLIVEVLVHGLISKKIFTLEAKQEEGVLDGRRIENNIPLSVKINSDNLMQTTRGSMIKAKFLFKFGGLAYSSCDGNKEVKVTREIGVFKRTVQMPMGMAFKPPTQWKPQQAQAYSFSVNMNTNYPVQPMTNQAGPQLNPPKMPMSKPMSNMNQGGGYQQVKNSGRNMNAVHPGYNQRGVPNGFGQPMVQPNVPSVKF